MNESAFRLWKTALSFHPNSVVIVRDGESNQTKCEANCEALCILVNPFVPTAFTSALALSLARWAKTLMAILRDLAYACRGSFPTSSADDTACPLKRDPWRGLETCCCCKRRL